METKVRMSKQWQKKLKGFEGLRLKKYTCPGGVETIGYGHTCKASTPMYITEAEAEQYFLQDIAEAEKSVAILEQEVGTFTAGQWDALTSFTFNIGGSRLLRSSLANYIRQDKNSENVGICFEMWSYANGVKLKGLALRRQAEKNRYYEKD